MQRGLKAVQNLREGSSPKAETRLPVRDLRGSVSAASRAQPPKADAPLHINVMFGKLFAEQPVAIRQQR
jgi:hypothetical protein